MRERRDSDATLATERLLDDGVERQRLTRNPERVKLFARPELFDPSFERFEHTQSLLTARRGHASPV